MENKYKLRIDNISNKIKPTAKDFGVIQNRLKETKNKEYTIKEMVQAIENGKCFYLCEFGENETINKDNVIASRFLAIDIDNMINKTTPLPAEEQWTPKYFFDLFEKDFGATPIIFYYSFSNGEKISGIDVIKFRMIYKIESPINTADFENFYTSIINKYNIDIQRIDTTKNINRLWAGTNTKVKLNENYKTISNDVIFSNLPNKKEKNNKKTAKSIGRPKKNDVNFEEGGRNNNLYKYLCGFVNNTQLRDYNTMLMFALGVNQFKCTPPLEQEEVETIVKSVIDNYTPADFLDEKGKVVPYILAETIVKDYNCISDKISSYIYNGKSYEEIPTCYYSIIDKYIDDDLKNLMKIQMTTEVTNHIYKQTYRGTIENQRGYINFKNGIYDIKNRKLIDHNKDIVTLGVNNGQYMENGGNIENTKFEQYLKSSLTEDLIPIIQEMLGVCLYPLTDKIHYFYVLTGSGRNGKGVLLSIIESLIPSNLRSGITMADYDTRFSNSSIKGKQINLCMDDNTQRLEGIGNLKSITAGEGIFAEKKGKDGEMIKALLTHISSFNELPSIKEKAPALFDRMIVIPFNKRFGTAEEVARGEKDAIRDTNLKQYIIKNELDIIINWALEGLLRIIDNGYVFTTAKSSEDKKEEYMLSTDSSLEWIKENVTPIEGLRIDQYIKGSQMYTHYKTWCSLSENEKKPLGKQKFFDSIRRKLNSSWKNHNNTDKYSIKLKYIGEKTKNTIYNDENIDYPF